jgi:hypothetical protein
VWLIFCRSITLHLFFDDRKKEFCFKNLRLWFLLGCRAMHVHLGNASFYFIPLDFYVQSPFRCLLSLLKIPPLLAAPHENLTRDLSSSSSFTFELKKEKKKVTARRKNQQLKNTI